MILIQDQSLDPFVAHCKLAVLECLSEMEHAIHVYSSRQALAWYLEEILREMRQAGFSIGLTRIVLVCSDLRHVAEVERRMEPGHEPAAWQAPDAWLVLYDRIDELRDRARRFNPQFIPRAVALAARGL
jgi:hypothetical protein